MKLQLLATLLLLATTGWAEFRAGSAKVDITPKVWPVQLVGSFSERLADKAHDPLFARAIVCDDGQTRLAIVIVDNCLIGRNYLDRAKSCKPWTLRFGRDISVPCRRVVVIGSCARRHSYATWTRRHSPARRTGG